MWIEKLGKKVRIDSWKNSSRENITPKNWVTINGYSLLCPSNVQMFHIFPISKLQLAESLPIWTAEIMSIVILTNVSVIQVQTTFDSVISDFPLYYHWPLWLKCAGLNLSIYRWFPNVLLPEGKCMIKRQLYSEPFTLREAASFIFQHWC